MEPESVGSVTEETARLLDVLFGAAPAARPAPSGPETGPETGGEPEADPAAAPCPTCGHVPGSTHTAATTAEVCHLCPVCQLLRVVRAVRPETLDRLADLAGAVTDTLRDAAAARWRESATEPGRGDSTRPTAATVEDIQVKDDDRPDEREDGA